MFFSILFITSCGCGTKSSLATASNANEGKKRATGYGYRVVNSYPHSTTSYTQGLYWHDGYLWEGTGEFGTSALLKVELESGEILERRPLGKEYFGEGIALFDDKIYQLTWFNQKAFVYDAKTLKLLKEIDYSGEGWGITTDGNTLYMSDGSQHLYTVNPKTLKRESRTTVTLNGRPLREINELEWIEGRIWANVFVRDQIVIINPESGVVEGVVELEGILPESERHPNTDVLNGIAYDAELGRIFVTGKNWSRLFEIEIVEIDE